MIDTPHIQQFDLCAHLVRDKKHLFQKCLPLEQIKDTSKLKFPMWASEKFDGVFCCAVRKPDGSIGIYSRTGEEYLSLEHLKPFYDFIFEHGDAREVIFEAYNPTANQATTSGACRDTKGQHPEILAYFHTVITPKNMCQYTNRYEFKAGAFGIESPYILKHVGIEAARCIRFVNHMQVDDLEEALKLAEEVWQRGGEGIILNDMFARYQPGKRNASMIKIKKILSFDLEVVGVYEGAGKYKGALGGLVCRWKNGKTIKVSGMTDLQRKEWWKNPTEIIGRIVEVQAMSESSKGMLREPRFKCIRYDKEEADY